MISTEISYQGYILKLNNYKTNEKIRYLFFTN